MEYERKGDLKKHQISVPMRGEEGQRWWVGTLLLSFGMSVMD